MPSNQLPNLPAPQRQPLQCERFVPQATNRGETVPPTCQTSPNPSSLNCLLHIDGRLWATQFGRQRPKRPHLQIQIKKKNIWSPDLFGAPKCGHQNESSHGTWYHVQTHQSVITNSSKKNPNCKGKRYYGASPILKHTLYKLEALSLLNLGWTIWATTATTNPIQYTDITQICHQDSPSLTHHPPRFFEGS